MLSEGMFCYRDEASGLWGYIDTEGNVVIEPQFFEVYPFSKGLAAVKGSDGKWDFIDKTGKEVISGNYNWIHQRYKLDGLKPELDFYLNGLYENTFTAKGFLNGEALVRTDDGFQIIDAKGNVIKELNYNDILYDGLEVHSTCCYYGDFLVEIGQGGYDPSDPYGSALSHTSIGYDKYFNEIYGSNSEHVFPSRFCSSLLLCSGSILNPQGEVVYELSKRHNEKYDDNARLTIYYTDKYYTAIRSVGDITQMAAYNMATG